MNPRRSLKVTPAVLLLLAGVPLVQSAEVDTSTPFDIKGLSLSIKQDALLRLADGPEAFKCSDDKENYRTQTCEATFERKNCTTFKIPVFPYEMADCKSVFRPVEVLPSALRRMATIGGNRVKVIRVSFFEGKAVKLVVFHEGINKGEFMEGMKTNYGPPSSQITGSRDTYDDVVVWSRGNQTLRAGAARLELTSMSVEAERSQRLRDDMTAAQAQSQSEVERRKQEAKKKAKSDI